ncbi:MAG: 50S ribosomal protein L10 [Patescibacteria group bacterium]
MNKITQIAKKSQNRVKKEQIVAELVEKIDNSNGLVFADFQGLTHKQLESLKKELKKLDSTIVIAKNSLIKLSLGQSKNYADFKDNEGLNLPTATLFIGGDMIEPLKKLQKLIKELNLPKIKFGILEGQLLDESGVLKIASLPTRDTLLAQFVGTLNSPIQGLVVTLNGNIQKLALVLDQIKNQKSNLKNTN